MCVRPSVCPVFFSNARAIAPYDSPGAAPLRSCISTKAIKYSKYEIALFQPFCLKAGAVGNYAAEFQPCVWKLGIISKCFDAVGWAARRASGL